ncbi:MAG: DNA-3-methyladenine glycosylase family protein [Chloroflexia bacterium]
MLALDTLQVKQGTLEPRRPFSFERTLDFVGSFSPAMGEQQVGPGSLTKAVLINEKPVVFRVDAGDEPGESLHYRVFSREPLTPDEEAAAVDRVRFYLSLDDDLEPFYSIAEGDPPMRRVVEQLHGFHQVKFLTPFENACWAVLTQRTPIPVARGMKRRLVEAYGGSLTLEDTTYWAFPEPGPLARSGQDEISRVIGHEQKADNLHNVARAFDSVDEQWLRTGDYNEVAAWLRGIKGFGEWSTSFVLARGLGRTETIQPDEKHLLAAASKAYGQPLTPTSLAALAAPYAGWQGHWALYLRTQA